jgi:HK97 family phage major capsid protein
MVDIRKALNEGTAAEGGYAVPEEQANKFLDLVQQNNSAIALCDQWTMETDTKNIPTIASGNTAYWPAELGTITSSDLATGQVVLTAVKVAAITEISTELLDDSDPQIGQKVSEQLARDVSIAIDQAIYNGGLTGYTASGLNGFRDTTEYTDINTVASTETNGDAISVDKILKAKKEIKNDYFVAGGSHLVINPSLEYKLQGLVDSNGRPLFSALDTQNPLYSTGVIGKILGLIVVVTPAIPSNLTKGSGTTLTDAIVLTKGVSGIYAQRRSVRFNKEYQIVKDSYKIQTNMRVAFRVAYQKSVCLIKHLITA